MASHEHLAHTPAPVEHIDEWHHHSQAEGVPQHEHAAIASPGILVKWFVIMVVTMVFVLVVLNMYYGHYANAEKHRKIENPARIVKDAREYKTRELSAMQGTYEWVDHDHVRIPIEAAKAKVIEQYQAAPRPAGAALSPGAK